MKLSKLIAGAAAAAITASSLAAVASANEAFLMYTDDSWLWGCWSAAEFPAGTVDVTEDGTYTVFVDSTIDTAQVEDEETGDLVPCVANGAMVFCVDIDGLADEYGFASAGHNDWTTADKQAAVAEAGITVSDVKITTYSTDGTTADIPVDMSKLIYGDIEANGKLRIELQNEYGDSKANPSIDKSAISFDDKIEVTFTITGLNGGGAAAADTEAPAETEAPVEETTVEETTAAPETEAAVEETEAAPVEETPAPVEDAVPGTGDSDVQAAVETTKGSPDTGVADVAAVAGIAVVAAGAFVVAKKRK